MNKSEPLTVEKFIPGGQTLATAQDGRKVFLWNALPGETVTEYQITKKKSHYFEAIATKIVNPSTHRVAPKDACFLSTSPWQIIDYNYELAIKSELLVESFRQENIQIDYPEVRTDEKPYFYRNKMEYSLFWDNTDEKIHLSFHQRGSHRKIKIDSSSIERPELFAKAQEIINELNAQHAEARQYQSLLLRCNQQGHVEGGLFENYQPHPSFQKLEDQILNHNYSYSPNGFFQINLPVYEMALQEIQKHVLTQNVLDLYSGVGTIGLSIAGNKNLTLVECDKSAYQEMVNNCKDFPSAHPVLAKSEEALEYIQPDQTVIVDPPRAGCDNKLIEKILSVQPTCIIYLSCNPSTQARDVRKLISAYSIQKIVSFNFFPRTPHLENLVILYKNS